MATLTMTPTRQPLGCLNSHMPSSNLNRQNQHVMSIKSCMKSSIFIDNSENVNPAVSTKRKRSLEDDDKSKPVKTSRMGMALSTRSINNSPRLSTPLKTSTATPKSAPILKPAGRSPPPKSSKSATRRSLIAKPRADQHKRGIARPFSLASVLSQSKTPKPTPKTPASWCFDIHVDTEQEEMTNLMQHSTTVLDISDDEGKTDVSSRGKENIPPHELGIEIPHSSSSATAVPAPRKADVMEESRSPLGELRAADYYAEDCNAFSCVAVYDDEEHSSEFKKTSSPLAQTQDDISSSIASVLEAVATKTETDRQRESTDENAKPAL